VLEEFFCLGLRSPHRMTYDPPTGRIFIGDVGESAREEVDVIEPGESGLNFQWNRCEGNAGANDAAVHRHQPRAGAGLSAHRRPRGHRRLRLSRQGIRADLGGKYIFGDNVYRTIWAMDETTTPVKKNVLCVMPKGTGPNSGSDYTGLSSFGVDAGRRIYFCQMSSIGGRIYKLQRGGPPPPSHPLPKLLSQTGVFTDLAQLAAGKFFDSLHRQFAAVVGRRGENPLDHAARRHTIHFLRRTANGPSPPAPSS
jgi:hypothetical protein